MPTVLQWLFELFVRERPRGAPAMDLTAGVLVGGAEDPPFEDVDLVVAVSDAREAERLLRALLRVGTVGRVWLAIGGELSPSEARGLRRFGRRLRPVGLDVRSMASDVSTTGS